MLQRKCSDLSEIKSLLGSRAALFDRINQDIYEGRVGIWGYGFLGRWLADWLISETGKIPLVFDSNFNNGKLSSQHSIRNPKTINTSCTGILISARHNVKPIGVMMEATGVPYMSADEFFLHKLFFDYERVFHLFEDDKSRATLRAILNSLISAEIVCDELVYGMYFQPPEFFPSFDDYFVDAGAYTGDTLEEFVRLNLGTFNRITCFEPGFLQFEKLKKRKDRLLESWIVDECQIILERRAVGEVSQTAVLNVASSDTMAHHIVTDHDASSIEQISVIALDDYLNGDPASFLKSDVEGHDLGFVKGARQTIINHRPKLAVSCYHYPTDLIEIFDYIDKLGCSYKFKLRHHANVLGDYVLYAYT